MAAKHNLDLSNRDTNDTDLESILFQSVCAIGVFDGFHKGHAELLSHAIALSQQKDCRCVVITFDRDPDEFFATDSFKKLQTNDDRISTLLHIPNISDVVVLSFTKELTLLSGYEFLKILFESNLPLSIHVGTNFRFGFRALGTVSDLITWGRERGVSIDICDLLCDEGCAVSSSRIRTLLSLGKIREANSLLGHRYAVCGRVEPGRGQGHDMGFATANIHLPLHTLAIPEGVYAGYAHMKDADASLFKAAISLGTPPTFPDSAANCEVHILDFSGDIYAEMLVVEFVDYRRPMLKFSDVDTLIQTISQDINWVRSCLS